MRQTTIEAIGNFVNIITTEKLEADLTKIVPGFLALYKKHPDHFYVSQVIFNKILQKGKDIIYSFLNIIIKKAICMLISAINEAKLTGIELLLENIMKELFAQLLSSIDGVNSGNANIIKNHNELLRCFAELCKKIHFK